MRLTADADAAAAGEDNVELDLLEMAVQRRELPWGQAPQARAECPGLELRRHVRVRHPELVRGAPEDISGVQHARHPGNVPVAAL